MQTIACIPSCFAFEQRPDAQSQTRIRDMREMSHDATQSHETCVMSHVMNFVN